MDHAEKQRINLIFILNAIKADMWGSEHTVRAAVKHRGMLGESHLLKIMKEIKPIIKKTQRYYAIKNL